VSLQRTPWRGLIRWRYEGLREVVSGSGHV